MATFLCRQGDHRKEVQLYYLLLFIKCSTAVAYLLAEQGQEQAEWVLCPSANHQGGCQLLAEVGHGLSLELQLELRLEQPLVEKLEQLPQSRHLNKMNGNNEM